MKNVKLWSSVIVLILLLTSFTQPKYKLVEVEWIDITTTDPGWHTIEEIEEWIEQSTGKVKQAGYIYKDTNNYLVLIDSYFEDDILGCAVKIPKGCIIKIRKL